MSAAVGPRGRCGSPAPECLPARLHAGPSPDTKFLESGRLDGQSGRMIKRSGPRAKRLWVQTLRARLCDLRGRD